MIILLLSHHSPYEGGGQLLLQWQCVVHAADHWTGGIQFQVLCFPNYSSDLLRLKTLLLSDDEDDDELNSLAAVNDALRSAGLSDIAADHHVSKDASKRRRGNSSQSIKQKESGTPRKTRLSWELHPSLLLHDLDYQVGEIIQSISDDGDDHEEQQV